MSRIYALYVVAVLLAIFRIVVMNTLCNDLTETPDCPLCSPSRTTGRHHSSSQYYFFVQTTGASRLVIVITLLLKYANVFDTVVIYN